MKNKIIIILIIVALLVVSSFYVIKKSKEYRSTTQQPINNVSASVPPLDEKPSLVAGVRVGSIQSSSLGKYLTDTRGVTLYVFADDKKLQSSCADTCAKSWPPFMYDDKRWDKENDALSNRMNVMKRSDGTLQYAYGIKPVYYYAGDTILGDTKGNGLEEGKWSIVHITD